MKGSVSKYTISGSSRPRWRYRIELGRNGNGKRLWDGKGGYEKQGDASDAMRKRMEELQSPAPQMPLEDKQKLGEWLQKWLDTYALDRCQPKTLERYRQLATYILVPPTDAIPKIADVPLVELSHRQIEAALYGLLKAKAQRRAHVSARTVRHVAGLLSVALNKAFRLELIDSNPMLRVELPKIQKKDARSLTSEEIHRLRETCRGDWTFALVELALAIGARRGELLALEWADVNWSGATIAISKSLEQTKAGLRIKKPKNERPRACRIPQAALAALRFVADQQESSKIAFGKDYIDQNLIFCEADGRYHQPDLISQVIVRRMRKAGIKCASFHTLRHTHASNLLSRGVSLPAVSARLGHSDPNVTARIYSHALPPDDEKAAHVWDDVIATSVQ